LNLFLLYACQNFATPDKSLWPGCRISPVVLNDRRGESVFLALALGGLRRKQHRQIAEAFYRETLQKKVSAAEFVSQRRARSLRRMATTTPLAYIFYGHTAIALHKEKSKK
jgi:hypothetical protein